MKNLIFVHMPRSAGITLDQIIERQFKKEEIFTLVNNEESVNELKKNIGINKRPVKCIKGHYPYGGHVFLDGETNYITLLRNPVDRIISHYYATINRSHHYLHNKVISNNISLTDYVSMGLTSEMSNGQTQLLVGKEEAISHEISETEALNYIEKAKRNLSGFAAVGIVEKFDESLVLFKRRLKWKNILYIKKNFTPNRLLKSQLSAEEQAVIDKYNQLDQEIYSYGIKMFEEMIKKEGFGFQIEVRLFKISNYCYNILRSTYTAIKKLIKHNK